ncbi:MAG TPA: BadF/BadG/BcrA/BcrD ATPase family protein [Candidatus Limnocylindrales bacterium]|nr:BadF/BadG/BcrA/BcrD ATPase family protein [Candidatus Limnocylindrales bacterium]
MSEPRAAVLAVDGGNSKTDLALVSRAGALLALVHGPTISHQQVPIQAAMDRLAGFVEQARADGGVKGPIEIGSFCLAGADFASDVRLLRDAIGAEQVAKRVEVRNDAFAALRAGSPSGWGVVVICGAGVNAVGVGPSGREARLAGIGDLSGDWGGGHAVGQAALAAAVRARDGRGAQTSLTAIVPRELGLRRPIDVTRAMYDGRMSRRRLEELSPLVFAAAGEGDAVARAIVDRLADEVAVMATAIARRLRVASRDVDVVLTGGVFRTEERGFYARIEERLLATLPHARTRRLTERPVLGAALIGLDALGAARGGAAERRLRSAFAGAPLG